MKIRYIEILKISLYLKLPQLIGIYLLTGGIVMYKHGLDVCFPDPQSWGLPVNAPILLILGSLLSIGATLVPFGVMPTPDIQNVNRSERATWIIMELTLLLIVAALIIFFDIDALKLYWSKRQSC